MTQSQPPITGTTHTLPFDKLSPRDFERLCLWLVERGGYERAEHLGAAGRDRGCDIVAWRQGALWVFQCKRVQHFGPQDALAEVEKVLALTEASRPVGLVFLVACDVSANTRQKARARCAGEMECHFWASTELDEKVKRHPDIVEEFFADSQACVETTVSATVSHATDSTLVTAGRDVYINVEREPSLPNPERVLAHRAALTSKAEYRRWADEFYIREEGKILPLLASPYDADTFQQGEDLLEAIRAYDRLLVLGEPGIGKTVAIQRMMWETAQAANPVVPIFVPLLFFQGDLIEAVRVALNETDELSLDEAKNVRAFLRQTRCLIMFDGLNEVPGQQRERAVGAIADFLREFPRHHYVVTSRSQDELWRKLRTSGAIEDAVVIQRIKNEQARGYLIAHLGDRKGRDLHDRLNECLRGLSRTPLLLWMIKEAGLAGKELPGNRGELFDRFVDRMLARDVKLETTVPSVIKKRALAHLAFTLQQVHQLACEREHAVQIMTRVRSQHDAVTILKEALVHGLLQGEQQVRFLHQSVQEYLVGLALCEAARAERQAPSWQQVCRRLLRRNLAVWAQDDWWAESFVQMAGLTEDPSWLVREIAPVEPWLAFWCSIEGKPVDEATRAIVEADTIVLLRSEDAKQRLQAVRELGRFENPRTIEYLISILEDEDDNVVNAAAQVLARLGEPAVEPLLAVLHGNQSIRWVATRVLGQIWELGDLVKLGDSQSDIRRGAAEALGELGDVRAVEPLIAALKDSDWKTRSRAAGALGRLGDARAVEPLIAALKDSDWKTRSGAAEALGRLGDARAVEPLIAAFEDNERQVWRRTVEVLGKLGESAVEPLIAALKDSDWKTRSGAAEALGKLGDARAVEPLITVLKDSDWEVQLSAAEALRCIGTPEAWDAVCEYEARTFWWW